MSRRLGMPCPHCQNRAQVSASKQHTRTHRELYFLCTNLVCGHSWVAELEAVRTISPSGIPCPLIRLPVLKRAEVESINDHITPSKQRSFWDDKKQST